MDDAADGIDGGIDRTVARSGCLELFARNVEPDAGYRLDAYACRYLQEVEADAGIGRALFTHEHQYIVVVDVFFAVGQFEERLIGFVERLFVELDAQQVKAVLEGGSSAAGGQYNRGFVDTHLFGVDNLVALAILQHAVLMDARRVGKGVASHDGLVGLYRHIHQIRYEAARAVNLLGVDVGFDLQVVVALANHGDLLERGVSGPFADAVDGHLGLPGSVLDAGHGVGRSHTQVVVAVGSDDHAVYPLDVLHEVANLLAELVGQAVAGGVGYVDDGGPGLDDGLDDASQIFVVGTACIFGVELYIFDISFGILDGSDSPLDNLFTSRVELVFDVVVRGAYTGVYAFVLGILQGLGRYLDVVLDCPGERTDGGPGHRLGYGYDRCKVAGAGYRETGFDNVDPEGFERFGYLYFFYGVELTAGHLLAVSQGCVENVQSV